MTMELGERIRRERRRRDERQVDTAARFGVSQATLHRWESGVNKPDVSQFAAVADYLGMSVDEVYFLAMEAPKPSTLTGLQSEVDTLRRDLAVLADRLSEAMARIDQLEHPAATAKVAATKVAAAKAKGRKG